MARYGCLLVPLFQCSSDAQNANRREWHGPLCMKSWSCAKLSATRCWLVGLCGSTNATHVVAINCTVFLYIVMVVGASHASTPWKVFALNVQFTGHTLTSIMTMRTNRWIISSSLVSQFMQMQIVPSAALNATLSILTFKMPSEFFDYFRLLKRKIVFISIARFIVKLRCCKYI